MRFPSLALLAEHAVAVLRRFPWTLGAGAVAAAAAIVASSSGTDAFSVMQSGSAGDAGAWVGEQASAAAEAGLGLLVGMNVLNGGTSASGLAGTIEGKFAMSASQLRTWGSVLVAQSQVCGLVMSRYDDAYFGRSDVKEAVAILAEKAGARAATPCRVRS